MIPTTDYLSQGPDTTQGMVCVVCGWWNPPAGTPWKDPAGRSAVCPGCQASLQPGGEVRLPSGVLVRSLLVHEGPIRKAVHAMKYRGADRVAWGLAPLMADLLPKGATAVVPVTRSLPRRARFGTDPGRALATALARTAVLPVADVLRAPVLHRSQIRSRRRGGLRFRSVARPPGGAVLVDDVLTTGATLSAAAGACGGAVTAAVTLTRSRPGGGGKSLRSAHGGPDTRAGNPVDR